MNTVPTNVYAQDASNPNKSNSKIIPPPFLSFASHNVRSFTNTAKQHTLIENYLSLNIDAIGLQKTKFLSQHIRPFNHEHSSNFVGFFSSDSAYNKTGFGVGILLRPFLANHVFQHKHLFNRIIYVDLQFTNKQKLRFINCYLPPSDVPERKTIQKELIKIINDANAKDFQIILTGDFNADIDRPKNPTGAKEFFTVLQNFNLFDACTLKYSNNRINHPTFKSSTATSRIDFV